MNLSPEGNELDNLVNLIQRRKSKGLQLDELKIGFDSVSLLDIDSNTKLRSARATLRDLVPSVVFEV